jgi:protocatechuate 3,4-dioxygenase alpha subunit
VVVSPFQTVGPYFDIFLRKRVPLQMVTPETRGQRISIDGVLYDGAGMVIPDGLVEIWQADADGRYAHPDDPRGASADPSFYGYGWRHTDAAGGFHFDTIKPGPIAALSTSPSGGESQAPHILVSVMGRGILTRFITRLYFDDEAANAQDAVLQLVPEARRQTLVARTTSPGQYRFDIRLQGAGETVFFDA